MHARSCQRAQLWQGARLGRMLARACAEAFEKARTLWSIVRCAVKVKGPRRERRDLQNESRYRALAGSAKVPDEFGVLGGAGGPGEVRSGRHRVHARMPLDVWMAPGEVETSVRPDEGVRSVLTDGF